MLMVSKNTKMTKNPTIITTTKTPLKIPLSEHSNTMCTQKTINLHTPENSFHHKLHSKKTHTTQRSKLCIVLSVLYKYPLLMNYQKCIQYCNYYKTTPYRPTMTNPQTLAQYYMYCNTQYKAYLANPIEEHPTLTVLQKAPLNYDSSIRSILYHALQNHP